VATLRNVAGEEIERDLWTTCFTSRELRLIAHAAGLVDIRISGVTPGNYVSGAVTLQNPELLLLARTPTDR